MVLLSKCMLIFRSIRCQGAENEADQGHPKTTIYEDDYFYDFPVFGPSAGVFFGFWALSLRCRAISFGSMWLVELAPFCRGRRAILFSRPGHLAVESKSNYLLVLDGFRSRSQDPYIRLGNPSLIPKISIR